MGLGAKSEYDYAIIRTKPMENTTTSIGAKVGTLPLSTVDPTSGALSWSFAVQGYPDSSNSDWMYTSSHQVRPTFSSGGEGLARSLDRDTNAIVWPCHLPVRSAGVPLEPQAKWRAFSRSVAIFAIEE
jgi:hypothetical protein